MTRAALNASTELVEMSRATGIAVERLQLLGRVAEGDGVAVETFNRQLARLNRTIGEARQGVGEAVDAFEALDLDPTRFENAGDALDVVVDALSRIGNDAERAALAQDLFGRGIERLLPVLARGSDELRQQESGFARYGVVSQEAAEANKALVQTFTNVGTAVSASLQNALGFVSRNLFGLTGAADAARGASDRAASSFDSLKESAAAAADSVNSLSGALNASAMESELEKTQARYTALLERRNDALDKLAETNVRMRRLEEETSRRFGTLTRPMSPEDRADVMELGALRVQAESLTAELALLEPEIAAVGRRIEELTADSDAWMEAFEPWSLAVHEAALLNRDFSESLKRLAADTDAAIESLRRGLEARRFLRDERRAFNNFLQSTTANYEDAIVRVAKADERRNAAMLQTLQRQYAETLASQEAVLSPLRGAFSDFARTAITDISSVGDAFGNLARRIADIAIELLIVKPLIESIFGAPGGAGGLFGRLFGGGLPQGFARGGLASGLAVVGERGPELVDFRTPARVYSAGDTAGLLGGERVVVQQNMTFNGVEEAGLRAAAADIAIATAAAVTSQMRTNMRRPSATRRDIAGR